MVVIPARVVGAGAAVLARDARVVFAPPRVVAAAAGRPMEVVLAAFRLSVAFLEEPTDLG